MTVHIGKTAPVSAIVLAFNVERYVTEAMDSILSQTVLPFQIIVVNDGSTDGTAQVVERFKGDVEYVEQPNQGIGSALNLGIRRARGEFITFLDGDDLWTPDKLEKLLAAFDCDPSLDLAFGHVRHFFSPEMSAEARARLICPPDPLPGYLHGAVLARRSAFDRVGSFETQWRMGHFVDWYARAREVGLPQAMLPEVVLHRRLHGENMSLRELEVRRGFVLAIKAARERRRTK